MRRSSRMRGCARAATCRRCSGCPGLQGPAPGGGRAHSGRLRRHPRAGADRGRARRGLAAPGRRGHGRHDAGARVRADLLHRDRSDRPARGHALTTRRGTRAAAAGARLLPSLRGCCRSGTRSDGAGSTRSPAAVCGLVGIKGTRGRMSLHPSASFRSWGSEGPLARTVADAALLLDVMAEPPPGDLYGSPRETSFLDAAGRDPDRPLRVLAYADPGLGVDVDPEVRQSVDDAAALLRDARPRGRRGEQPVPVRRRAARRRCWW